MNNFENLKAMSTDQLAEWLDEHGAFDSAPWTLWFDKRYCANCPSETTLIPDCGAEPVYYTPRTCAWCEIHDKCRFFQDLDDVPYGKDIVKMWLETSA